MCLKQRKNYEILVTEESTIILKSAMTFQLDSFIVQSYYTKSVNHPSAYHLFSEEVHLM